MFGHERFRVLSSLAATGQLSVDEDQELTKHLLECESCREVHDAYTHLVQHQLPQANFGKSRKHTADSRVPPDLEIRDRFFGRARAEGVDFSAVAERPKRLTGAYKFPNFLIRSWRPLTAVCALAVIVIVAMWSARRYQASRRPELTETVTGRRQESENLAQRQQLQSLRRTVESQAAQLNAMRSESDASKETLRKYEEELQRARSRLSAATDTANTKTKGYRDVGRPMGAIVAEPAERKDGLAQQQPVAPGDLISGNQRHESGDQSKSSAGVSGGIVFTGSSSIAYWGSLANDMEPLTVFNSAFSGAQYTDLLDREDALVIRYHPSAVVVYAGDNDLAAAGARKTPQAVAADVVQFVHVIHSKLPDAWVYVLSIKPSYARWSIWPKMNEANHLIEEFLRSDDHAQYVDVASTMFDANGDLPEDLFLADGIHPSSKCYALWAAIIKPILLNRVGAGKASSQKPVASLLDSNLMKHSDQRPLALR